MSNKVPHLGLGVGWRPELALAIHRRRDLGFIELTAENFDFDAPVPRPVEQLRSRGLHIVPHGISLSLGGAEPITEQRVAPLATMAQRVGAPLVSEHIAFVRAGGIEAGHLLPVPRTRAMLEVLSENVLRAKEFLPVPLALENISALFDWPDAEMDEAAFVTQLLERTDCLLLLDIANVYANARNLGGDPVELLKRLPLERIAYVHVGGGFEKDGVYHDSHAHPVPPQVIAMLDELCALTCPGGVLLERDDHYPPESELNRELDAMAAATRRGTERREQSRG